MAMSVTNSRDFGGLVRRQRRAQGLTQAELAGVSGVGLRYIVDLEKGKPTCSLDKALQVLQMLGVELTAQEPGDAA